MKKLSLFFAAFLLSATTLVSAQTIRAVANWSPTVAPFYQELLNLLSQKMKDTTFEMLPSAGVAKDEQMLVEGKADLILALKDKKNAKKFRFSYPILSSELTYLTRKSAAKKPSDLKGQFVCSVNSPIFLEQIESIGAKPKIYGTWQEVFDSLFELRCAGVIANRETNTLFMRSHPKYRKDIKHHRKILNSSKLKMRFAVAKDNKGLQRQLNYAILLISEDGSYRQLMQKHFGVL